MANEIIDVNFSSLDSCASRIGTIDDTIQAKINEINTCYSSLDSRVKQYLGESYSTNDLQTIYNRLEKIKNFLGEVKSVYSQGDFDLSSSLNVEYLEYLYPDFKDLSDERKAIVLSALRYLGLTADQMTYGRNFSSQYSSSQFAGDATEHAWCAMFVGSIINYYFGDKSIIDPSYASVWKIIGNYNNQTGIAFETDDRIHYYVSQALVEKYKATLQADGTSGLPGWEKNLASYNSEHGTNLKVSDWINDGYIPQAGDILVFKQGNHEYVALSKNDTLEEYNQKTDQNKAAFISDMSSHDYPNDISSYTHIGFVLGTRNVDGVTYVDTVEGNVVNDVRVRSFRIDDPYLVGYGHIDYEKFESDKTAIQNMLATGVDTSVSKATAGSMSQHLLALKTENMRGNYLVNLANNIDSYGDTQQVSLVTNSPVGVIQTSTVTTTQEPLKDTMTTVTATVVSTTSPQVTTTHHTTYQSVTTTATSDKTVTTTRRTVSTSSPVVTTTTPASVSTVPTTSAPVQTITSTVSETTPTVTPAATPRTQAPVEYVVSSPSSPSAGISYEPYVPVVDTPSVEAEISSSSGLVPTSPPFVDNLYGEDDYNYELDVNDDWMDMESQNDSSVLEEPDLNPTMPSGTVVYDENTSVPSNSTSKSGLGKVLLATLGVGAAAGGAYYAATKAKKNNTTGEEDEVKDDYSEEESYDEY